METQQMTSPLEAWTRHFAITLPLHREWRSTTIQTSFPKAVKWALPGIL